MNAGDSGSSVRPSVKLLPDLVLYVDTGGAKLKVEFQARCELFFERELAGSVAAYLDSGNFVGLKKLVEPAIPYDASDEFVSIVDQGFIGQAEPAPGQLWMLGKIKPNLVLVRDSEWDYAVLRIQCEVDLRDFATLHALETLLLEDPTHATLAEARRVVERLGGGAGPAHRAIVGLAFEGQPQW